MKQALGKAFLNGIYNFEALPCPDFLDGQDKEIRTGQKTFLIKKF